MVMPTLFIGHGSPMNAIEKNRYTRQWRALATTMPTPKAILVISAHWLTEGTAITFAAQPETIHDFYGFPSSLYDIHYPAPSSAQLVKRVQALASPHPVFADTSWGFDHGAWSVLVNMYPEATIPTLQLSLDITKPESFHYELGQRLATLRHEGVLILGSGNIVHNLQLLDWQSAEPAPYYWAEEFDQFVKTSLMQGKDEDLIHYKNHQEAHLSVPTPEHFLPLLYILGARLPSDQLTFPVEGIEKSCLSMRSVLLSSTSR